MTKVESNGVDNLILHAKNLFYNNYGNQKGAQLILTPCSLVLLGDHTHYNDGILLSTALNKYSAIVIRKRDDRTINLFDAKTMVKLSFDISELDTQHETAFKHSLCFLKILKQKFTLDYGFDSLFHSDIPECLGLGALTSTEVGFAFAIKKILNLNVNDKELLELVKNCELTTIGKISNIAHHYTTKFSKENRFFTMDIRTKEYKSIQLKTNSINLVVFNTQERIPNVASICNERIEECEVGVKGLRLYIWGIKNLRDIEQDFLLRHYHMLPKRIFNRVLYNVKERKRAEEAIKFLKKEMLVEFGECISDSHWSLVDDYELSCPQCDYIVEASEKINGVLGSKMISCSPWRATFHIVKEENTNNFIKQIKKLYKDKFQTELIAYNFNITNGLKEILIKEHETANIS